MSKARPQPSATISLRMYVLMVMAMRKNPETWDTDFSAGGSITARGYTMHSLFRPFGKHLDDFKLINMLVRPQRSEGGNSRIGVYPDYLGSPLPGHFLSPDNHIQAPGNPQNYNRYAYALNNPLKYTDPSGEVIFTALATFIPGLQPFIPLAVFMDMASFTGAARADMNGENVFGGFAKGAATGLVGGAMGTALTTTGMTFAGQVGAGMITGGVTGATDAAIWGNDIGRGFTSGAIMGGASAAFFEGLNRLKRNHIFAQGRDALGLNNPSEPIPKNDEFLLEATKAWNLDSELSKTRYFTFENTPKGMIGEMDIAGAAAMTEPVLTSKKTLTGLSDVFFHERAFADAETLFYTIAEEMVHVSQVSLLKGYSHSFLDKSLFIAGMDYWAYSYRSHLGDNLIGNSFTPTIYYNKYPNLFMKMNWRNFNWTLGAKFKYPF